MAPNEDSSSEDPSKISDSSGQSPNEYEKIVEELRSVLSGLHNSPLAPAPQTFEPTSQEDELLRQPQIISPPQNDLESEKLGEAAFKQASEPTSSTPPSDADFWNGNVLGWPSGSNGPSLTPPSPEKLREPKDQAFSEPPMDQPWLSEPIADLPQIFTPSAEQKVSEPEFSQEPSFVDNDFSLPEPPSPPSSEEVDFDAEAEPIKEFSLKEVPAALPISPPLDPRLEIKNEERKASFLDNIRIPIPGTLHQMPESPKKKKGDQTLEEMNIKPSDHVQVACLFPEGQEQLANDFIFKLKTAAAKSSEFPDIEIVLSTPWFMAQIEPHAWKKAASISGAHFLFVLAYKKDKDLFKELSKIRHPDEVRARMVGVEQIGLKTLYSDLLADVMRSFNVQG